MSVKAQNRRSSPPNARGGIASLAGCCMPPSVNDKVTSQTPMLAYPRRATLEDLLDIAKIHRLSFFTAMPQMPVLHTPAEDLNFYTTGVFTSSEIWLLEASSDVIVGFIAFRPGWVDHLYIHPDCQRRGLGSALLTLAQASADALRLWTFQDNTGARRFYEKHGFRIEQQTDGAHNEEKQPDVLYVWERDAVTGGQKG
jgi:ribosomal protein S18 acetylase RimI-like enzyme